MNVLRLADLDPERHEGLVEVWLARIRLKPDTRVEVVPWGNYRGEVTVEITRMLPDSTSGISTLEDYANTRRFVRVSASVAVPGYTLQRDSFEDFWRWLHHELLKMEAHELDEWFRVDDTLPFDPHRRQA